MPGSLESMRWNACVRKLDLSLCSRPKEFLGNGVRTTVSSKGKIPSTRELKTRSYLNSREAIYLSPTL